MRKPEIAVIAFVAPVGSELGKIIEYSEKTLESYGCEVRKCEISSYFEEWLTADGGPEAKEILHRLQNTRRDSIQNIEAKMDAGDLLCAKQSKADGLARLVVEKIRNQVSVSCGDKPVAYLLRQLKRSDELNYLKSIFGDGLFTIGVYGAKEFRLDHLVDFAKCDRNLAESLIKRDDGTALPKYGQKKYGQGIQKLFHSVDAFVDSFSGSDQWQVSLDRIFELLMGNPFIAPLAHEHAMFSAFTASLQSLDLSRQVGAVITDDQFNVLSSGFNEVPKALGGQYRGNDDQQLLFHGQDDGRDFRRGVDSNRRAILDVVKHMRPEGKELSDQEAAQWLEDNPDCPLVSTSDFGRPVHAEMSAILACGRRGISTQGTIMFCTTYPCQNCAKHILCSGVKAVYFIEPYPKSLAMNNHKDALFEQTAADSNCCTHVTLRPYMGIGPRRYYDLFALKSGGAVDLRRKASAAGDLAQSFKWPEDANKIRSDSEDLGFPRNHIPDAL